MLEKVFVDLQKAWVNVLDLSFEHAGSEVNPALANIVSPNEVVVVNQFHIEIDGGGGDMHITFPYSMIEPIRDQLDAGIQSDVADNDDRWVESLRREILDCKVNLNCKIAEREIALRDLVDLNPGDVIPIDLADTHILTANDIPMFRAHLGRRGANLALRILGPAGATDG